MYHEVKGYVTEVGPNKWQLEVNLGTYVDPDTGKKKRNRKYKTVKAKNEKQAQILLAKYIAEITGEGYFEPKKMNFVHFVLNEWEPKCARKRLADTTYETYMEIVHNRILPAFKYLSLEQITPKHIVDFLHNLEEEGMRLDLEKDENGNLVRKEGKLSSSSIYYHYRVLNHILNFAVEIQIIKDNPCKAIEKPKVEHKEVEIYTRDEVIRLLECLESEKHVPHWQIIFKLAIITGMRRSELCGLEFKHFDYDECKVHIKQALTYTKENGYSIHEIRKGKRTARQRTVYLPRDLIEEVKKLEHQRKIERFAIGKKNLWLEGKYNLILAHEDGRPYHPRTVQRWWERFIKRHGLKYINVHALRHTSATMLIMEGVNVKTVSARLGHSSTRVTTGTYGHAVDEYDKLATEKLQEIINMNKHASGK